MEIKLKKLRVASGLTQKELADESDLTAASIRKWESGQAMPSALAIYQLAKALHCTPNDLLGWDDETIQSELNEDKVVDNYRSSSSDGKELIETVAKYAAEHR